MELCRNILNCVLGLSVLEGCCIAFDTIKGCDFGRESFYQVTDCHSRWDSVRVDNEVRCDTLLGEGHVLLLVCHSDRTFLSVTTGELVTDLRDSYRSHFNLGKKVALLVKSEDNRINFSIF